jgi:hypothetical protein
VPKNGIYILFEAGETAHGGDRIVRVGTHTGQYQLRSRLRQHFVVPNKDRSIFRKNIGRALLNMDQDPFAVQWELDLTSSKAKASHGTQIDLDRQQRVEERVSGYIQSMFSFSVIPVETKEMRLLLESRMISTVSLCKECRSSSQWLGAWSPKEKIRDSGLWLVNELYKTPLSPDDFHALSQNVVW